MSLLRRVLDLPARPQCTPVDDGYPFAADSEGRHITLPSRGSGLRHCLIGGATGAGKSGYVNAITAAAALDPACAIIGVDLKGGVELQPWAPRLTRLAVDHNDADQLAADLVALVRARLHLMRAYGWRSWPVSLDLPLLLVVLDELSEVFGEDLEHNPPPVARVKAQQRKGRLESIARLGRAAGVVLVSATQRPAADLISPDYRGNHAVSILLWVRNRTIAEMIVGELPTGLEPTTALSLDTPGVAWWWPAGTSLPRPIRSVYYDDDAVAVRVARTRHLCVPWAALTDPLQPGSHTAVGCHTPQSAAPIPSMKWG